MAEYTVIESYGERFAPPEAQVLKVGIVGEQVFLDICEYEEDFDHSTVKTTAGIDVPLEELFHALQLHYHASEKRRDR